MEKKVFISICQGKVWESLFFCFGKGDVGVLFFSNEGGFLFRVKGRKNVGRKEKLSEKCFVTNVIVTHFKYQFVFRFAYAPITLRRRKDEGIRLEGKGFLAFGT